MDVLYQAMGSAQSASTGAGNVSWPVHVTNDIGILLVETQGEEAVNNISAGWTALASSPQNAGTGLTRLSAFWKRAASAAEGNATFDAPGNHLHAKIITIRGCKTTGSPIDAEAGGTKAVASTSTSIAGVTASQGGNDVLYVSARDNDSALAAWSLEANANLTGLTERSDTGTGLGLGGGIGAWSGNLAAAGPTGTLTATVTSCAEAFICIAFLAPTFQAAWARGSNQVITPGVV